MPEPSEFRLVYITAGSQQEALRVARALVEARLAACANVRDQITSLYWWEGKLQEDPEAVVIAKTRASLMDQLIAKVREVHSYDCPCVVALPIYEGHAEFLNWIARETSAAR
jgi:periplasmic divalent cation tolerance protein